MARVRPGFTLIELLVVIILIGISSVMSINAAISSRQNALFQVEFQEAMLLVQEMRSAAQTPNQEEGVSGYGVRFVLQNGQQLIESFADRDGNGLLTAPDELDTAIDLADSDFVFMDVEALSRSVRGRFGFFNFTVFTIFFPNNQLDCEMKQSLGTGSTTGGELLKLEVAFGQEEGDFDELVRQDLHQILTMHHLGCIPEVSTDRLR